MSLWARSGLYMYTKYEETLQLTTVVALMRLLHAYIYMHHKVNSMSAYPINHSAIIVVVYKLPTMATCVCMHT